MSSKFKKSLPLIGLAMILAIIALLYIKKHYYTTILADPLIDNTKPPVALPPVTSIGNEEPTGIPEAPPEHLQLPVPFTPQAPTANWDALHNEACEEASAIMAYAYFSGMTETTLKPAYVEQEITKLTQWETDNLGYYLDINSEETAKMITAVYGLKAEVVSGFDEAEIKKYLADNKLVLVATDGKLLGNPNFRSPGPPYHMVVIRGYNGSQFITNDPGTRKGLNYPYSFATLYKANGDFNHATHEVDTMKKNMIVVWKE